MAKIFGVSNHTPEVLVQALVKSKIAQSHSDVGIIPVNSKLSATAKHKCLLFLTPADLHRNIPTLSTQSYQGCHAFLFANPMRVHELTGVTPLDFEANPEYPGFGFTLKSLSLAPVKCAKADSVVTRRNGKYLSKLIRYVQKGSLLNPLMTFIYTLPSSAQGRVKTAVVKWLYLGKPRSFLERILEDVASGAITQRTKDKLATILFTDAGTAYQKAFAEFRRLKKEGSPVNIAKLAKTFDVSDYEMRYILSVIEDNKRASNYADSFEKAKNRKRA